MNRTNRVRINYNEKIFFNPQDGRKSSNNNNKLTNLISNVITSSKTSQRSKDSTIRFNVNINNNYYNANYNYVINNGEAGGKTTEDSGINGFFSKYV
jgi:hypothetical protein